jgi:hypothetical protein
MAHERRDKGRREVEREGQREGTPPCARKLRSATCDRSRERRDVQVSGGHLDHSARCACLLVVARVAAAILIGMATLVPCPDCRRHVRLSDASCPFCSAPLDSAALLRRVVPGVDRRLSRAAALAVVATLSLAACDDEGEGGGSGGSLSSLYGAPVAGASGTSGQGGAGGEENGGAGGEENGGMGNSAGMYGAPPAGAGPIYGAPPAGAGGEPSGAGGETSGAGGESSGAGGESAGAGGESAGPMYGAPPAGSGGAGLTRSFTPRAGRPVPW